MRLWKRTAALTLALAMTLSAAALAATGWQNFGLDNMAYDPATGVFGRNMPVEIQGTWMTTDALSPATKADFDRFMADRYE